jgi:hypothetical protein
VTAAATCSLGRPIALSLFVRCTDSLLACPITPLALPLFLAECLTRVATNGPYTTTTTPEPLVDQCWWERAALRQEYTRANRRPPSVLQAPIRLNSARYSSVFSAALPARLQNASLCPHQPPPKHTGLPQIFQLLFRRRAWLTSSTKLPLAD